MQPELEISQNSSNKSPIIQNSADEIMALVEQARMQERQMTSTAATAYYRDLVQNIQRRSQVYQENQAMELVKCQQELADSKIKFDDLQTRKLADEAALKSLSIQNHALRNERDAMLQKMTEIRNIAYMSGAEACHTATVSDLKKYGLVYWGPNSLSFGESWLRLWNQYVTEDSLEKMSSDHRITQKEMDILLENFIDQLRRDKDSIQTLEQHLSVLQDECTFRSRLSNNHLKPSSSLEMKTESVYPTNHVNIGDHSEDYQATQFIKSEPGLDISGL